MADTPKYRREAMLLEIEHRIDPDHTLEPTERRKQAEAPLHEKYRRMGLRSAESRRARAARLEQMAPVIDAETKALAS